MTIGLKELIEHAEKKLVGVHPLVATKARQLIERAYREGINVIITQGLRTVEEQNELYAQGRTKPGKIVTNAKGGYSYHNYGLAFDFAILNADGSVNWNIDEKWKRVGALGKSLGLEWGGDWPSFKDYPHFQYTFGLSLADLRAGKRPPTTTTQKEVQQVKDDVKGHWAEASIRKAMEKGVIKGYTDGTFKPDEPVTRAQLAVILDRLGLLE
ncbi:M15 family metallopeptidase [Bhargavaea massiliensis]